MPESALKIFSYLPNPRVWKAQIAADLIGLELEVVGDRPAKLANWLWDFNPRPLAEDERTADSPHARRSYRGFTGTLYKTDAFLAAHPFGTVPAAFSPDGEVGIFESNAILRAVARCGEGHDLYGCNGYQASRIDSFLDAALVFTREAQVYLLGMEDMTPETHQRMASAYEFYLEGIERSLSRGPFIAGDVLTIVDIAFACDLSQFLRESDFEGPLAERGLGVISDKGEDSYPLAYGHLAMLGNRPEFARYLSS